MKIAFAIILFLISSLCNLEGQDQITGEFRGNELNGELVRMTGYFDYVIPFELYHSKEEECTGFIRYGGDQEMIPIEGTCTDTVLSLYEFDPFSRVSGIIEGTIDNGSYDLTWSSFDRNSHYKIDGDVKIRAVPKIEVYQLKSENSFNQLLLYESKKLIATSNIDDPLITWTNFDCPVAPYACQMQTDEGLQSFSMTEENITLNGGIYQKSSPVSIQSISKHGFQYFYHFNVPSIGDSEFDSYIAQIATSKIESFKEHLVLEEEDAPENRLKFSAVGDFQITLVSSEVISGFLTFYSTMKPRLQTIPFSFDRNKKKFYRIKDIWRKDFDFAFYLKSVIENEKRNILRKSDALVRNTVRDVPFSHFGFTPQSLLLFTDYNIVFGRKFIHIPYADISGFIDNRSLQNFINKKSKS